MFLLLSFANALTFPTYALIINAIAIILMCYIHYAVSFPAIQCTEDPLYGNDPQGFFDQKVRLTAIMWVAGIIAMVVLFAVAKYVAYPPSYPELVPDIDITGSAILLMFSLAPYIPATFALMKASYVYDWGIMNLLTRAMNVVMLALIFVFLILWYGLSPDFIFSFYTFETIPFLPLCIFVLAASMIITYYLSKSAKRSFIRYINDENV